MVTGVVAPSLVGVTIVLLVAVVVVSEGVVAGIVLRSIFRILYSPIDPQYPVLLFWVTNGCAGVGGEVDWSSCG